MLVCNGPGTCVPIIFAYFLNKVLENRDICPFYLLTDTFDLSKDENTLH